MNITMSTPRCTQCASINIKSLLSTRQQHTIHIPPKPTSCPLCNFFLSIIAYPKHPNTLTHDDKEIEFSIFNNLQAEDHIPHDVSAPRPKRHMIKCQWGQEWIDADIIDLHILLSDKNHGLPIWQPRLMDQTVDYEVIKEWIKECCSKHENERCGSFEPHEGNIKGMRVIDVETRYVVPFLGGEDYAALSYVWGYVEGKPLVPPGKDGKLPEEIPKTIEDAIEVTKGLGVKWLWVDQFCIDQEDMTQKMGQIAVMDRIYSCAWVTIVAAVCGTNSWYGLPGTERTKRVKQPRFKDDGIELVLGGRKGYFTVTGSKWFSRGWTFQEGLFSRRRVIFTDEQVLWECNMMSRMESVVTPRVEGRQIEGELIFDGGVFRGGGDRLDLWRQVVSYRERKLTFGGDVLNAMMGVFSAFSRKSKRVVFPVRQFFGVPISTGLYYREGLDAAFACAMQWQWVRGGEEEIKRREGFPSWSWAGWEEGVFDTSRMDHNYMGMKAVDGLKFWFQRVEDLGFDRLTETVVQKANRYDGNPLPYTYTLKIESLVCNATIETLPWDDGALKSRPPEMDYTIRRPKRMNSTEEVVPCWRVRFLTDLQSLLVGEKANGWFSCLLLATRDIEQSWGLILWHREGHPAERVGSVDYRSGHSWSEKKSRVVMSVDLSSAQGYLLAEELLFEKQTVLLA
ncbi:heterokaryon incompatibility protein-domain-containing protein [Podospora fimiseda]|uniref:Heterokaryon incompatibility protein-domain-containing protein n=1 Tax=Podospora fimiseda TaxID=252190 RepID=A0AAN7BSM9_9PEZI|nr:heterokaryon incompatibility protein-domain-containing protein [Podospora fimiseda]